jgi:ribosomal-protein-alanine N-acetyltransferase
MLTTSLLPLTSGNTRLRPLEEVDAPAFADGTRDEAVRRYGHLPEPSYTSSSVIEMIRHEATPGLARGELAVLAIADTATDAFCGSLVLFDVTDDSAEVGFWLHPDHRGSGRTAVALDLACDLARRSGLSRLTARTVPDNTASQRILHRAGFTPSGTVADQAPSGERVELLHYRRSLTVGG